MSELNKYSKTITQDPTQPAAQAMFYGIGLTDEDLAKAQVGIASMGWDGNTCNMHLNELAADIKKSVWANDLFLANIILQRGGTHAFSERLHVRSYAIFVKLK
mgnify:CR=1 FL=1